MKSLFREVHRRWLWQAFLMYVAFSAFAFVVSLEIAERRSLPDGFTAFALILLIVGLPIVLITAAVQEGIPKVGRSDPALRVAAEDPSDPDAVGLEPQARGVWRVFTWRNAMLGGFVAFIIWALVATAWLITADQWVSGVKKNSAEEAVNGGGQ